MKNPELKSEEWNPEFSEAPTRKLSTQELLKRIAEQDQMLVKYVCNYERILDERDKRIEDAAQVVAWLEGVLREIVAQERAFMSDPEGEAGVTHRQISIARTALKALEGK